MKSRVYPLKRQDSGTTDATLLVVVVVLQSGAAVAVVWAHARTQNL